MKITAQYTTISKVPGRLIQYVHVRSTRKAVIHLGKIVPAVPNGVRDLSYSLHINGQIVPVRPIV